MREVLANATALRQHIAHVRVDARGVGLVGEVAIHEAHDGERALPDVRLPGDSIHGETPDFRRVADVGAGLQEVIATFDPHTLGQAAQRCWGQVRGQQIRGELHAGEIRLEPGRERADGGGRGVELGHPVLVAHLPEARGIRVVRYALEQQGNGAVGQRAVDDIAVAGDPADIGGTPENVVVFQIECPLSG